MTVTAITDTLLTYEDVQRRLGLSRTDDPAFFPEWQLPLPTLSVAETSELEHLSQRYLTYIEAGEVSEGTLNLIVVAPLLPWGCVTRPTECGAKPGCRWPCP